MYSRILFAHQPPLGRRSIVAFTLIELLVVIAIIAILAAMRRGVPGKHDSHQPDLDHYR